MSEERIAELLTDAISDSKGLKLHLITENKINIYVNTK